MAVGGHFDVRRRLDLDAQELPFDLGNQVVVGAVTEGDQHFGSLADQPLNRGCFTQIALLAAVDQALFDHALTVRVREDAYRPLTAVKAKSDLSLSFVTESTRFRQFQRAHK